MNKTIEKIMEAVETHPNAMWIEGELTITDNILRKVLQGQLGGKVLVPVADCINDGCGNTGCFPEQVGEDDWEPCQCEFCYTVPNSRFNINAILKAMTEAGDVPVEYGCHCDLEPHMKPDACVLDENRPRDCIYAVGLKASGRGKESCQYWQPITIVTEAWEGK